MKDSSSSSADPFKWVIEATNNPQLTPAHMLVNWLAVEVDPTLTDLTGALVNPTTALVTLGALKDAFKHLRLEGETADDRSLAATYYALTIAAAIVSHKTRISRQSDQAIEDALRVVWSDESSDLRLRDLAWRAFVTMRSGLTASRP